MRREIFSEEHDLFREQFRRFVRDEVEPHVAGWNEAGQSEDPAVALLEQLGYAYVPPDALESERRQGDFDSLALWVQDPRLERDLDACLQG